MFFFEDFLTRYFEDITRGSAEDNSRVLYFEDFLTLYFEDTTRFRLFFPSCSIVISINFFNVAFLL